MIPTKMRRRSLLRYMGIAGLVAPFIGSLRAGAQTAAAPKRLIIMASPNGTIMDELFPNADGTFKRILAPLESLRSKVQVVRGFDVKSAFVEPIPRDHWPDNINMLTARQARGDGISQNAGLSIDQHIANGLAGKTKFKSVHLGVGATGSFNTRISFTAPGASVAPENSPFNAFNNLFAGAPSSTTTMVDVAAQRKLAERRSILDGVQAELAALRCELGAVERTQLDSHLSSVREIELAMTFDAPPPTASCAPPTLGASYDLNDRANFPKTTQLQMDILAAAVACDLSRVFTLQFTWGSDNFSHPWIGISSGHHDIAHGNIGGMTEETRREHQVNIDRWYASQFAYLAKKLDAIPEGGGTALDNTVCVWIHEQVDASSHKRTDVPYVLAGSCGGYLRTGLQQTVAGLPHARFLTTLANAMNVPTSQFGDPQFDSSPLDSLRR